MTTKQESSKDVGIWIRVSTEDQAREEAYEHHEERARYYAKAKDWNVLEIYRLEAVSGKAVLDHPEAKSLMRLLFPVEHAILNRLADVDGADDFRCLEVGDCAGDLQDPGIGAGA